MSNIAFIIDQTILKDFKNLPIKKKEEYLNRVNDIRFQCDNGAYHDYLCSPSCSNLKREILEDIRKQKPLKR